MPLRLSNCTIDLDRRRVATTKGETRLSPLEVGLLRYLAARTGRLVSRKELLVEVWGYAPGVQSRAVDKVITRLRRKLEVDPSCPEHLVSAYGGGYGLNVPAADFKKAGQPFVGRTAELAEARARLEEHGLVSIVGPPGAGKTTLASQLQTHMSDELVFCDLRRARSGTEVYVVVSGALGIALGAADDVERLERALDARVGMLVLLDNAEQLDPSGDAAVARLARCRARAIITSRRPVGFAGEPVMRLSPMPMDEAQALFCVRAREARPGVHLSADDVAYLTQALDGLPLAIELAAARIRVLEVPEVIALLQQRFSLLRGGDVDILSSLAWSWSLLEPWEQAALAQLSVLEGRFEFTTAEAIVDLSSWSDSPWILNTIDRLVEHSLIEVSRESGRTEYDLLESVRSYARTQLGEADRTQALARHGAWFGRLSEELLTRRFGRFGLETRRRLRTARDDLFAALTRVTPEQAVPIASALDVLLETMGPADKRHEIWTAIDISALTVRSRAHVLRRRGDAALRSGQAEQALVDLEAARELSAPDQLAPTMANLGAACLMLGQLDRAEPSLHEALGRLEDIENPWAEFTTVANLGTLAWLRGALDEADTRYNQALTIAREARDVPAQALCLGWLSGLHVQRGAHEHALAVLEQAEEACRAVDNRVGELSAIGNQGVVALERGEFSTARRAFGEAIDGAAALGERRMMGLFLGNLALVDLRLGAHAQAADRFSEAIATQARKGGDRRLEAYLTAWRAAARLPMYGPDAARRAVAEAGEVLDSLGDTMGLALVALCGAMIDPVTRADALELANLPGANGLVPCRDCSDVRIALQILEQMAH